MTSEANYTRVRGQEEVIYTKKVNKRIVPVVAVLAIIAAILISGCTGNPETGNVKPLATPSQIVPVATSNDAMPVLAIEDAIIGTWSKDTGKDSFVAFQFDKNGTVILGGTLPDGSVAVNIGSYRLDDNKNINMTFPIKEGSYNRVSEVVKVTRDTLVLKDRGNGKSATLTRVQ